MEPNIIMIGSQLIMTRIDVIAFIAKYMCIIIDMGNLYLYLSL